MATRIYLPNSVTDTRFHPTFSGQQSGSALRRVATLTPARGGGNVVAMTIGSGAISLNDDFSVCFRQYMLPNILAAQTIHAGTTFTAQILGAEATSTNNFFLGMVVSLMHQDGSKISIALSPTGGGLTKFSSTSTNRGTTRTVSADTQLTRGPYRLLIELGMYLSSGVANDTVKLNFGDTGTTDLGVDETDTSLAKAPWVECSQTLLFSAGSGTFSSD